MAEDAVVKLRVETASMINGLADVKAGFDMVVGGARSLGEALDSVMTRGKQFSDLQRFNTLSINQARSAVKGLVDDMTLLRAANTATEFQLGLTAEQFATFANAAVVQSQKLGIDASKALDDLLLGTARGSKKILDNLGFIVKQGASVAEVVEEINKKVGDQTVQVGGLGGAWAKFKISLDNVYSRLSKFAAEDDVSAGQLAAVNKALDIFADKTSLADKGTLEWMRSLEQIPGWLIPVRDQLVGVNDALEDYQSIVNIIAQGKGAGLLGFTGKEPGSTAYGGGEIAPTGLFGDSTELKGKPKKSPRSSARHAARGVAGVDYVPAEYTATAADAERAERQLYESDPDVQRVLKESLQGVADAELKATQAKRKHTEENKKQLESQLAIIQAHKEQVAETQQLKAEIQDMTVGALANFVGGMWAAADAAIQGKESFGMAIAKMTKDVLLGLAQQATVKAVFETAEGIADLAVMDYPGATKHFTAAGIFGGIALGSGASGLAVSAGIKSAGGYDRGSRARGRESAAGRDSYRPSFGSKRQTERPNVYLEVYLTNNPDDPGAALLQTAHVSRAIAKAAA